MMILHGYWRSSASYRVRIALALKGVAYKSRTWDLRHNAQYSPDLVALNPMSSVPVLQTDQGPLTQSMAIIEWLEAEVPEPSLLSDDPLISARIRAAAQVIASDVHPLNNLAVLKKLRGMGHDESQLSDWMHHWMQRGLAAFQTMISDKGDFCFGDSPSLADVCLIPQLYNARRWEMDFSSLEPLVAVEARCLTHPAFIGALPENQIDAIEEIPT
ncbi:maleylacetoacetate isomerase [Litoreibacter albidus]|uniref:maleylacetoacetate isomerase n=1 Tax=Litoreibacter albidus TaxID=670155 RepID=UPI00373681ED